MQAARDADGQWVLVLERSEDTALIRDPATGDRRRVPAATVAPVDASPLAVVASALDTDGERGDGRVGLLVELVDRGPTAARTLSTTYDVCESDLHGLLVEFRAAGLVAETRIGGEPGYEPTDAARRLVDRLRDGG
ncbi:hypothetical protein BRD17_01500 [Halobacteriales archaeon SW_7_68_16]|nr:MAG: hypothetical protein BRD17_01500 [Halobacteriales archaeon SW_7_68_16]